ncbi:hypothetical protein FQA47_009380 [Oryzias melastigma]|uniref:Uncharacterized protein n=1 Tax=Oryzias melastigma TaxID=30732 RepID=A0A834CMU0_ORYME|nr:hypothetical protein FQA47_009380 [Oryzias melastigma]
MAFPKGCANLDKLYSGFSSSSSSPLPPSPPPPLLLFLSPRRSPLPEKTRLQGDVAIKHLCLHAHTDVTGAELSHLSRELGGGQFGGPVGYRETTQGECEGCQPSAWGLGSATVSREVSGRQSVRAAPLRAGCMSGCSPTFLPALHLCTQTPPPPPPPPIIPCHHLSSHHTPPPLQAAAAEQEEALRLSGAGRACR